MADETNNQTPEESSVNETPKAEAQPEQSTPAPDAPTPDAPAADAAAGPAASGQQGYRGGQGGGRGGQGGQGGRGGQRGGGRGQRRDERTGPDSDLEETVVKVYRCATVVRGGRRFSFAALVVVGDRKSRVGIGYGKANEVPNAVEKATKAARRAMITIKLDGTTVPHQMMARYGASKVQLVPAGEGTGVIAGESVRLVLEAAGVHNVLTKVHGSRSPKNLCKAVFEGLKNMRTKEEVAQLRGVTLTPSTR